MKDGRHDEKNGSNNEADKCHVPQSVNAQINGINSTINEMREEGENKFVKMDERFASVRSKIK